jgi:hypothetical protein
VCSPERGKKKWRGPLSLDSLDSSRVSKRQTIVRIGSSFSSRLALDLVEPITEAKDRPHQATEAFFGLRLWRRPLPRRPGFEAYLLEVPATLAKGLDRKPLGPSSFQSLEGRSAHSEPLGERIQAGATSGVLENPGDRLGTSRGEFNRR